VAGRILTDLPANIPKKLAIALEFLVPAQSRVRTSRLRVRERPPSKEGMIQTVSKLVLSFLRTKAPGVYSSTFPSAMHSTVPLRPINRSSSSMPTRCKPSMAQTSHMSHKHRAAGLYRSIIRCRCLIRYVFSPSLWHLKTLTPLQVPCSTPASADTSPQISSSGDACGSLWPAGATERSATRMATSELQPEPLPSPSDACRWSWCSWSPRTRRAWPYSQHPVSLWTAACQCRSEGSEKPTPHSRKLQPQWV
jgi:hypothetical protein